MRAEIEFFFDCSSPWSYLAFLNVQPLAAAMDAHIRWRPFVVGGVFNAVNPTVYQARQHAVPAKDAHGLKTLHDWARWSGIEFPRFPPTVFPVNSVKVMRICVVLGERGDHMTDFAKAAFEAYFRDDLDLSSDETVHTICAAADSMLDANELLAAIAEPSVKAALRANGDELIQRGGYGSPTMFVGGNDMYFGNDNLPLVRAALLKLRSGYTPSSQY